MGGMTAPATASRRTGTPAPRGHGRRSVGGLLRRLAVALPLEAAALYVAFGWHFSNAIRDGITVGPPSYERNVRIDAVPPGSVILSPLGDGPAALATDKVYGLDWGTGFGQVGALLGRAGDRVTRAVIGLTGSPMTAGQRARLTKDAFPDPLTALRLPVRDVTITSGGQQLPAWLAAGPGSTWAVLVHGRGATRAEMLRLMRATTGLGMPSLDISYRRDAETGGGLMRFGQDEWPDLEAAVRYALDSGAGRIVLVGCSSGAAVVASFMESSPVRRHVAAMVFDSPNLDLGETLAYGARARRLPGLRAPVPASLVWAARQITGLRFGIDFGQADHLDDTDWLTVPTLVFHGTDDDTVPPSMTQRLAKAQPRLVLAELVAGAGHVESWNVDPEAYDARVRRFLAPYSG